VRTHLIVQDYTGFRVEHHRSEHKIHCGSQRYGHSVLVDHGCMTRSMIDFDVKFWVIVFRGMCTILKRHLDTAEQQSTEKRTSVRLSATASAKTFVDISATRAVPLVIYGKSPIFVLVERETCYKKLGKGLTELRSRLVDTSALQETI
jgi:hypothetical protein